MVGESLLIRVMATELENALWRDMRKQLVLGIGGFKYWERLEVRSGGLPDVLLVSGLAQTMFCELKIGKVGVRGGVFVKMRDSQPGWHEKFTTSGGKSFILVRSSHTRLLSLFDGSIARKFLRPLHGSEFEDMALLHEAGWPVILDGMKKTNLALFVH